MNIEDLTQEQLETKVSPEVLVAHGLCVAGSRDYAKLLGLDFRAFMRGELTVGDFVKASEGSEDSYIENTIKFTLGLHS